MKITYIIASFVLALGLLSGCSKPAPAPVEPPAPAAEVMPAPAPEAAPAETAPTETVPAHDHSPETAPAQ